MLQVPYIFLFLLSCDLMAIFQPPSQKVEAKGEEAEAKVMTFRQKGNTLMREPVQTCEKMHTKSREEKVAFLV